MMPAREEERTVSHWQRKVLPFMMGMLVVLAGFFFVASTVQIYSLQKRIDNGPELNLNPVLSEQDQGSLVGLGGTRLDMMKWKTLTLLEANTVQNRYHQANVLLMSRVWTSYLGFVTGMVLAIVGAVFILGKLREESSTVGTESALWKITVTSTSPGLVLAILGTALMLSTILTHHAINVVDKPTYMSADTVGFDTNGQDREKELPPPLPLSAAPQDPAQGLKEKLGLGKSKTSPIP